MVKIFNLMFKKILFFALLIVNFENSYSQRSSNMYSMANYRYKSTDDYLKISRTLKTSGWISLGVGVPLFCLGFAFKVGSADNQNGEGARRTANWMMPCGAALTLSSVPLFIVSHHYKNKAIYSVSLGSQRIEFPQMGGEMGIKIQPALTLGLSLR